LEPIIVLVHPQMGENIGAAARVMANFGLRSLRLVAPRDGWPNPAAETMAVGAFDHVHVSLFDDVPAATRDVHVTFAACGLARDFNKRVLTGRGAVAEARVLAADGRSCAVLFGSERTGLDTDEIARASAVLTYPVEARFSSLNLAQAVAVFAHEWRADAGPPPNFVQPWESPPATRAEIDGLIDHVLAEVTDSGQLWPPHKADGMRNLLAAALGRHDYTAQEVQTLRGAVKALAHGRMNRWKSWAKQQGLDPKTPPPPLPRR